VLLATLDAPLLPEASEMAIDAAVESGQPLLVVNAVETALTRWTLTFGHDYIAPPGVEESLSAPAQLASSLGVRVERLRLRSPRPVDALLELSSERDVGLLVLGADPNSMRKRRYRRCVRKIVERSPCLVWVA
jgi:nucleotide-binding universal stress UspA family protein